VADSTADSMGDFMEAAGSMVEEEEGNSNTAKTLQL
jgi:hypothetical protein